jgi:hypothetical protein
LFVVAPATKFCPGWSASLNGCIFCRSAAVTTRQGTIGTVEAILDCNDEPRAIAEAKGSLSSIYSAVYFGCEVQASSICDDAINIVCVAATQRNVEQGLHGDVDCIVGYDARVAGRAER